MNDEIRTDGSTHSSNDAAKGTGGSNRPAAADVKPEQMYFGIGAGGEAASMWVFNALGLIFYQQILGLPAGLAATAMALAIIADAITDP